MLGCVWAWQAGRPVDGPANTACQQVASKCLAWSSAGISLHCAYYAICINTLPDILALVAGWNANGWLGDGTRTSRYSPTAVVGGLLFSQIAVGQYQSCALQVSSGLAYCWGTFWHSPQQATNLFVCMGVPVNWEPPPPPTHTHILACHACRDHGLHRPRWQWRFLRPHSRASRISRVFIPSCRGGCDLWHPIFDRGCVMLG